MFMGEENSEIIIIHYNKNVSLYIKWFHWLSEFTDLSEKGSMKK
jgi:hypothetical protein